MFGRPEARGRLFLVAMAALLFIIIGVAGSAQAQQIWQFDHSSHEILSCPGNQCMEMAKSMPGDENVSVPSGEIHYWLADQSVGEEIESIDFGSENWDLHIQCATEDISQSATLTFSLGYINSTNSQFVAFDGDSSVEVTCPSSLASGTLNPSEFNPTLTVDSAVVPSTDYLAVEVVHEDGVEAIVSIGEEVEGQAYTVLSYPNDDPGYPVWEATSVLLLGIGILGIAGWTRFGRSR